MRYINGYNNVYGITENGMVWSYKSNKFLKPKVNRGGYEEVILYINNKRKTVSIHRLVGIVYLYNLNNKPHINHIDGNKSNNDVSNLEWVTPSENMKHATKNGLSKSMGEDNGNTNLKKIQVEEMRKDHINRKIGEKTWKKYNISRTQYYRIINNESWKIQ